MYKNKLIVNEHNEEESHYFVLQQPIDKGILEARSRRIKNLSILLAGDLTKRQEQSTRGSA